MMSEDRLLDIAKKVMYDQNPEVQMAPSQYAQIIEHCKKHYVSILPNNLNRWIDPNTLSKYEIHTAQRQEIRTIDLEKIHIQELIRQLSIVLQLLVQICVLSPQNDVRAKSYQLLERIKNLMVRDVEQMEDSLMQKTGRPIVKQKVCFNEFLDNNKKEPIVIEIPPQISIYQDPLLYLCFHKTVHRQIFKPSSLDPLSRDIELLESYSPFFNRLYLPVLQQHCFKGKPNKSKFSALDDRLLLIGLTKHSSKNIEQIREVYLPNRAEDQLRNRVKNLCAKSCTSPIRQHKQQQYLPMTEIEIRRFAWGLAKFGPRFQVISKYLSIRSPKFLEQEYTDSAKLRKKRQRQGIKTASIRDKLFNYQPEMNVELSMQIEVHPEPRQFKPEGYFLQLKALEEESYNQPEQSCENSAEKYKIVGNLTFEYAQI